MIFCLCLIHGYTKQNNAITGVMMIVAYIGHKVQHAELAQLQWMGGIKLVPATEVLAQRSLPLIFVMSATYYVLFRRSLLSRIHFGNQELEESGYCPFWQRVGIPERNVSLSEMTIKRQIPSFCLFSCAVSLT